MTHPILPQLDASTVQPTRDAIHAWSCVLGHWLKFCRVPRKHWWHSSLRPSLTGLTTGVVRAEPDFELELDLLSSRSHVRTPGTVQSIDLVGQSPAELAVSVGQALIAAGVDSAMAPANEDRSENAFVDYDRGVAADMQAAFAFVATALERFRAVIREETSPIQLWPHHFDLAMIWLPGQKIAGQDPADEESADKQMNFGFVMGDSGIEEPYFYVTAYPTPDAFLDTELPAGAKWASEGFTGAVLMWSDLIAMERPADCLHDLWTKMLDAGQRHVAADD